MSGQSLQFDPVIRACQETDLPVLAELARHIWHQHYPGIISAEQIEYMLAQRYALPVLQQQLSTANHWLDGLWLGEQMIGFANYLLEADTREMKLDKLYLHPDLHGRGLGSLLLEYVSARARQQGCECLVLAVNKRNQKAINAYQRNGFEVRSATIQDIGAGYVMDDYLMAKAL